MQYASSSLILNKVMFDIHPVAVFLCTNAGYSGVSQLCIPVVLFSTVTFGAVLVLHRQTHLCSHYSLLYFPKHNIVFSLTSLIN